MENFRNVELLTIGLILLIASSCAVVKGKKELVYHRDQNNRLFAVSEVQHIKHEQVMDLMPKSMDKLVLLGKFKMIEPSPFDSTKVEKYENMAKDNLLLLNIGFWIFVANWVGTIVGTLMVTSSDIEWVGVFLLLLLLGIVSILASIAYLILFGIGVSQYINLKRYKRENNIHEEESLWHQFLYVFAWIILGLMALYIMYIILLLLGGY